MPAKITHPVGGYDGHVRVGDLGLHFLAGVAHADDLPDGARESLEEGGFTVEDTPDQD